MTKHSLKVCILVLTVLNACRQLAKDFVVSGTASESLYGACESMYKPDLVWNGFLLELLLVESTPFVQGIVLCSISLSQTMVTMLVDCVSHMFCQSMQEPEELFETISQALLSSVDRDCISGWGGIVYVV